MSGPGPFVAETDLQPPRGRHHSNPGSDTEDPPGDLDGLIQAADRTLEAALAFIDGDLDYGAFRLLAERYRAEVVRARLASSAQCAAGSDSARSDGGESDA